MKRGMLLPQPGAVRLRLGDYLVRANLPVVPKVFGHVGRAQPPVTGGFGDIGNRTAGNCPIAGGCHETQVLFWATGRPIPLFTDATGLADYSRALVAQGGPPYDPNNPATDTGLDPVALASWRQTVGLTDANGVVHKIGSFASINDPDELDLACYLFGVAAICWVLPNSAEDQFSQGEVWNDLSGVPAGGHYTAYVGRNSAGNRQVVTWGALQGTTDAYLAKYQFPQMRGLAYLSREYLLASGNSPEAINFAQLDEDMASFQEQGATS